MLRIKSLVAPLYAAIALTALTTAAPADAAVTNVTCTVRNVAYDNASGQLGVYCGNNSTWYFSQTAASVDSRRVWVAMAQAALLAGKQVVLANNTGVPAAQLGISWMQLNQ